MKEFFREFLLIEEKGENQLDKTESVMLKQQIQLLLNARKSGNKNRLIDNIIKPFSSTVERIVIDSFISSISLGTWDSGLFVEHIVTMYEDKTRLRAYVDDRNKPYDDSEGCSYFKSNRFITNADDSYNIFITYKHIPILVSVRFIPEHKDSSRGSLRVTLNSLKIHVDILKEYVYKITKYSKMKNNDDMYIDDRINKHVIGSSEVDFSKLEKRGFDTIFTDDEIVDKIKTSIKAFGDKREFYKTHGIPYHFGILLSGSPGTGKSSLIHAMISHHGAPCIYTSLSNMVKQANVIRDICTNSKTPIMIIIEDVDCEVLSTTRNEAEISKTVTTVSFNDVLNTLDGSNAFTNVIFILTTNHVENIEPALIRPGRIDLHLEIKHPSADGLDKFFKSFYNKSLYDSIDKRCIKSNISIADLQVKAMSGVTYEQLVKYITK